MSDRRTLDEFISLTKSEGLSKTSHYDVDIVSMPKIFKDPGNNVKSIGEPLDEKYMMYCKATALPGTNILTNEVTTFGENREMPYQRAYDNITLTFMVDINLKIKRFFEDWLNGIINPKTRVQEYYDNYVGNITITIGDGASKSSMERNGRTTTERFKMTLFECYPKNIGEMSLSYDSDGFAELPVTINYKYYTIDPIADSTKR